MLDSVLDSNNILQVNVDAIKILGLINAVYCAELINIFGKSKRKKKQQDGYFTVDRNYIRKRTSISIEDQYKCDSALKKVGIIEFNVDKPDVIKFSLEEYAKIISNDDCKFLDSISKKTKLVNSAETKAITKVKVIQALQNAIVQDNAQITNALKHWIEVNVLVDMRVTTDTVVNFQSVLMDYCKSDIAKALRIIEIATAQKWINPIYAIESYEKEIELITKKNKDVRRSVQKVATRESVNSEKTY